MYLDDRTLLPPGMEMPGEQDTYTIERFLGLGLTAQVYRAQQVSTGRIVALKVLRHDTSQVSRDHFWHEAQVLNELHYAGVTYVPAVLAQQKTGDLPFLALEYVDSEEYRPLDESLEPLLEQEALEVARQALAVLQALHEKVGRTYTDMQLKNFRWDSATRTLKILDWNHVSTQRKFIQPDELRYFGVQTFEELAQRDLARWGAYFYRLLTGKGALEQGETTRALAQRAGEQWERISVAARQIVCRALHPDPSRRYTTAAEFLAAVEALQVCWCEEVDEGRERHKLDDLLDTIKEATSPEALKQLDEVAARLDLLERRGVGLSTLRRRLERLIQGVVSAAWRSGKLYYGAAQYLQATQIWEAEAAAQGRADLWRWVLLARTGAQDAERFNRVREELERIIKALEQGALESAAWQQWKTLVAREPWLAQEGVPVHWLGVEIQVAQQVAAGRAAEVEGDATQDPETWNRAKAAFEDAIAALKTIPYGGLLCEIDDKQGLETKIEQLNEKILARSKDNEWAETISQDFQAITEAENEGEKKQEVLIQLKLILITTPGAQKTLEVCETKAREWQEIDPKFALEIVETVLLYGHTVDRAAWMKLRREQLSKKLADLDGQIRAAVGAGEWEQARTLAAAWPPEGRFELYPELVAYVREVFNQQLQQSLWEAWQAHELLKALGAEGTETRLEEWRRAKEELQARSEEAKQRVAKLQAQAGELVQRLQMQQQQLEAAEQARQKVEQHNAKLQKFREWVDGLYTRWQALKTERGVEAYPDILREIETVSWSLEDPYQDLTNEEVHQKWRTYLEQQKTWLEEQIKADSDSQRNLEEAQSRFNEALEKAQELTSEALESAKVSLQQAQKALNYQPPVQHQKRHAQLLAQVQSLDELLDVMNQKSLVLDVQKAKDLIKDCENLSGQDQGPFLSKFGICCELFGKVRAGFGSLLWPQAKSYFPLLEAMEKQLAEWRKLYPLSGNGQSQEVVLTVSLAPEDLKKLQDALTTTKNTLIEHINNLKPEKRQEGPMTWLPWAFSGLALVLSTILLALFFPQMRQLRQVRQDLAGLSTPTQVASVPFVSATPASLTETITVKPTETSIPTSTSTPTPTPTPTPMPPFTGVTLNWTRGITLYQMPALTLTAESGWTFTTTLTTPADSGNTTLVTSGIALNAEQTPWEIRVVVVNNQEQSMPLTGTLTVQDAQVAIWQPQKELSLLLGDYQVKIFFLHDKEQQVLQGEILAIMPYYNVSAERSRVYDPGQPGMSVIYRITNTGNTTDTFKLVLYNAKPSVPIRGVSGTITLTSGLTKEIGIQGEGPVRLTFVSPVPGAAPSTQSFSITLPELAPGQAMDIDLFVNTQRCPSMNLEFIPQNGKGTPLKKEEPFKGCR